jgi:hypothetical protein
MSDRAVQGASFENWCVNLTPWVRIPPHPSFSPIAQWLERLAVNQNVVGSNPTRRVYGLKSTRTTDFTLIRRIL